MNARDIVSAMTSHMRHSPFDKHLYKSCIFCNPQANKEHKVKILSLVMTTDGWVKAKAEGHATEVVRAFRDVCELLLSSRGPWRMTKIVGVSEDSDNLDSEMCWDLEAKNKDTLM
jgi:hypothetical protein